jgi:lipid-A-disaccharide synthase
MKYYLIAGEASGDLHASNLMRELRNLDPDAEFRFWGGDLMQKQGGELVKHYRDLSFMGFMEVLFHLRAIGKNFSICKKDLLNWRPDVLILVDYPGFNLRIANYAHSKGLRVFYYISPQLWAWRSSRVKIIKKSVERMFVILPFEKEFYLNHNYPVDFSGHPLLDEINAEDKFQDKAAFLKKNNLKETKPLIALLPGSRKQEISKILRIMLKVIPDFKEHQFVIAGAPSVPATFYKHLIGDRPVTVVFGSTYDLLHNSEAALVTSGTATLEVALLGIPQVVCYKGSFFSYLLARLVVHVKFISLVNLVMDKAIVRELIQAELTKENLSKELKEILYNKEIREQITSAYNLLNEKLGGKGASNKVARLMIQYLKQK